MQMQEDLSLFQKIATKLLQKEKENGVVKPIPPQELFDQLDLKLQDEALSEEDLEKALTDVVLNTPRTSTNLFFNQLFGGRQSKGTLGELIAAMLNNSMYTYKVGGPQVGIEKNIIKKVCELISYDENADGTFPPGGSMSNFMALIMARDAHNREIKNEGITSKMTVYTSEDSHYSIQKNTTFAGIGINQIRNIKTNANGQMDVDALAQQIAEDEEAGYKPCFVNATAGTTVLGVFDDIKAIHNVIKSKDIWLHVDGAYCGAAIFSDKYKHLLKGLELTDSFSFNAHKMLGVPLSCSIIVTQDKANLKHSFACDANYLYQTDGDDYNLGKTSIQCGRRNDALKFWTLWKSIGTKGLEQLVDKQFHLANVALDYVKNNPDYTVYSDVDSVSVCFNYKGINPKLLCNSLYEDAELMVGYGSFNEHTFVRLVTVNTCNEEEDILNFFKVLEAYVEKKQLVEVNV